MSKPSGRVKTWPFCAISAPVAMRGADTNMSSTIIRRSLAILSVSPIHSRAGRFPLEFASGSSSLLQLGQGVGSGRSRLNPLGLQIKFVILLAGRIVLDLEFRPFCILVGIVVTVSKLIGPEHQLA